MDAEVLERDVIWQSAVDQRMRGAADEHLPTMRRVRDPGGTVDVEPHVAVGRDCALTRVESHADRNAVAGWPALAGERSLCRACRFDGPASGPEHREECVTLGPELDAFVVGECLAEDRRGPLEEVRIVAPHRLEQSRRALDIGKEERYGPGRQGLAHRVILRRFTTTFQPGQFSIGPLVAATEPQPTADAAQPTTLLRALHHDVAGCPRIRGR